MRRRGLITVLLLTTPLALLAGDGDWWYRDWWGADIGRRLDRLAGPAPLAGLSGPACLRALAASGAGYVRIADFETAAGCRVDAAVRVHALDGAALSAPFVAACPLALATQRYVAQTVNPAAETLLGSRLARIDHVGSFACRRVRGRPGGPLSEHAYGRALDITGFATAKGRTVGLAGHWRAPETEEGRFLRRIAARRGPFSTLITPDDDRLHHDHIHVGLRPPHRHGR